MFLQEATQHELERAVAANHLAWMVRKAQAANGEVITTPEVTWTYAGTSGEAMVLFPELTEANADECLDTVIRYYLERQPKSLVGCWSLMPTQPSDLGIRLLARGFQPGWEPCWMWLNLQNLRSYHEEPDGMTIALVDDAVPWNVNHLPYYDRAEAPLRQRLQQLHPQQVWHFGAYLNGAPVGHSTLCLTTGALGVAGLYDIGVVPSAQHQGIGKAITRAACLHAQARGCRYALLNATGERMYRQLGFGKLGDGITWWLNVPRLARHMPSITQIRLAEAVGRGDLAALTPMDVPSSDLNTPLANGMTLIELAAYTEQLAVREWLIAHGAAP
jgi:GNAT superfamily N-acetyltransferase